MLAPPVSPPSRISPWEIVQAALLAVTLVWTTLANGGYGAQIERVTVLLTGSLVVVHALERAWARPNLCRLHPAGWLLLPFLVYALANVLWVTPVRWLGWRDWLGWAQMIAVFWVVLNGIRSRGPRRLLFFVLVALGIVEVILGCYQRFVRPEWKVPGAARGPEFFERASGSFSIPNSLAGFLLLLLPAVAALTLRRRASATERVWWGWVGAVLSLGLVLTLSRGAWFCLALALPLWPLLAARGGWRRRAGLAGLIFFACVAAGAVVVAKYPTARHRFTQLALDSGEVTRPIVWRGAWRLFRDAPIFGSGAGSYNVLFERYRPAGFRDEPVWAHNEYLNTMSDYGVVGLGLLIGAVGVMVARCAWRRRSERTRLYGGVAPWVVAGMGTGLLAFALQLTLDFHLKIPALALACAVIAGLAVRATWPVEDRRGHSGAGARLMAMAAAAGVALGVGFFFRPLLSAEATRAEATKVMDDLRDRSLDGPEGDRVRAAAQDRLREAVRQAPSNAQAWADLSRVTASIGRDRPAQARELGKEAEGQANRALGVSGVCSEFWIRRAVALDQQGRWVEAGRDFQQAIALAPAAAANWYYYADHLSRLFAAREAADAALDYCLRLDPGNQAGLALRQHLAIKKRPP